MKSASERSVPGTRPEGIQGEREAAAHVREMFGRIAPRYDFLNHLLSLDIDKIWRRRVAKRFRPILRRPSARVLDLCCGTGDLALALRKEAVAGAEIIGSDFVPQMLERARAKAAAYAANVTFVEADALDLPFDDGTFDLVSCSFGFRNLANYERGMLEILRVLRPGSSAAILEFAEPRGRIFGSLYRFYFRRIFPHFGGLLSGNAAAYSYLPNSVSKFPSPEALQTQMENAGFVDVRYERWTGGIVTLHTGRKQYGPPFQGETGLALKHSA